MNMDTDHGLTIYEYTNVIGTRAEQLARGAQPFVNVQFPSEAEDVNMYEIAERELAAGKLPFVVVRKMPNGTHQYIKLSRSTTTPTPTTTHTHAHAHAPHAPTSK